MWRVLLLLTVLTVNCEPYTKKHKVVPSRNQRIIKVQGPPHYNHFHGVQKPIRKRPIGVHQGGDNFIRPNYPPPIPPFFNGPSVNHKKHLPRPPPHVFHKSPSYGLGFPYKTLSSFRPSKDHFRIATRPALTSSSLSSSSSSSGSSVSSSSTTTYHSPTFTSSSFVSSPVASPVSHIISSDDNNGPIREIPAPNLAPKPHDDVYGGIVDIGGFGGTGHVAVGHIGGVSDVSHIGGVSDVSHIGGVSAVSHLGGVSEVSHLGGVGHIGGVSAIGGIGSVGVIGGGDVAHTETDAVVGSVVKDANVNLDDIVKDSGIESSTYLKESGGDPIFGKEHTVEIANFDEGSSIDVTKLIKNVDSGSEHHHSGYEVTEHHAHLPSNDQIVKGHDGSKLYYAPDPDPSLPVHKVPPTNDPHSTPSNGQTNINSVFLQQVPQGLPYLQSAPVASLSSQELFHLMHGYPVIQQPVVAFVSQPTISSAGHGYFQAGNVGQYAIENQQGGNDINQYLQQPEIHNLLHGSPKSHQEQEAHGVSHSSVVNHYSYSQQPVYSPQNYYETGSDSNGKDEGYPTSEINHNYQYEPEASESNQKNSLTVIRQTNEGTLNSETVKELLLEDTASNELNQKGSEGSTTIFQLKNLPEVPFYASLPSQKAAEALASLQAAGSVANNYMNRIKVTRGDQGPEEEERGRRGKADEEEEEDLQLSEQNQTGREKTVVEIQRSVPLYETSISSKNLVESETEDRQDDDTEFGTSGSETDNQQDDLTNIEYNDSGAFGKRLRPK